MKTKILFLLTLAGVVCVSVILSSSTMADSKAKMIRENLKAFSPRVLCQCDADCAMGMMCIGGECVPGEGYKIEGCKVANCGGDHTGSWNCSHCISKICTSTSKAGDFCVVYVPGSTGHFHCVSERSKPVRDVNCAH